MTLYNTDWTVHFLYLPKIVLKYGYTNDDALRKMQICKKKYESNKCRSKVMHVCVSLQRFLQKIKNIYVVNTNVKKYKEFSRLQMSIWGRDEYLIVHMNLDLAEQDEKE